MIQCQECGKQIANEYGMKTHMRKHQGKIVTCSYCPWTSHIKSKLWQHMRLHHKEEWVIEQERNKDIFKCPECDKVVVSKASLKLHLIRAHGHAHVTVKH